MTTKTYNVYKFDELPKEIQDKVVERYWDINLESDWYESTYEECEDLGFKIVEFDIDHGTIKLGKFTHDFVTIAQRIIKEHGEKCDTYATSANFLKARDKIVDQWPRDEDGELDDVSLLDEKLDACEAEYEHALAQDYLSILRKDYEYQSSREAIIETLKANDYDFTIDGKLD